jgi:predicted DNA-binding protein with PD1-like motif
MSTLLLHRGRLDRGARCQTLGGMKAKLLSEQGQKTFALVFDKGDEVVSELTAFAKERGLAASHFTAIGAFSEVTLGYFDRDRRDYAKIPVREQVEVLSLIGDIALDGGQPKLHAHVVVGKRDGTAHGGHLVEARVWPTLEVILEEAPQHLRRTMDPETGLALIDIRDMG